MKFQGCLILPALFGAAFVAVGCAPKFDEAGYVKGCVLPEDQVGTLSGRWASAPIPVSLRTGQFDPAETADIIKAADIWNKFSQASFGQRLIDYGDAANPRQSTAPKPTALCSTGIVSGTDFTGSVVIHKQGGWPYTNHDAIALTSYCPMPAKPVPSMYMAVMEVNYQDFFIDGKKVPDLTSIFVHEFGHLLGLDHSCDTKNRAGFPNCNDAAMPDDYYQAVMFPVVLFSSSGLGEVRQSLKPNDQGRTNCLYDTSAAAKTP